MCIFLTAKLYLLGLLNSTNNAFMMIHKTPKTTYCLYFGVQRYKVGLIFLFFS